MTKIQKDAELIVTRALVAELAQAQVKLNQPKPAQPQVKLNQPKCKLRSSSGRTPKAINLRIGKFLKTKIFKKHRDGIVIALHRETRKKL